MKHPRLVKPARTEAIDAGAILALCVVALYAFRSSYGGVEFLIIGTAAAALGIALAHLATMWRWPILVTAAAAVLLYVVVGGAASLHDRAIAGFIPSPQSMVAALRSVVTGWKELITTAPPVGRTGDLMVLPFLGGFVAGFVAYSLARRLRFAAPALLGPAVVLGVGIAAGTDKPVSLIVHGCVFGVLTIGWLAWREHHRRPLLEGARTNRRQLISGSAVLVAASFGGLALAPRLPFAHRESRAIWRQTVTPPFDPRQYPSPLSGYRRYVKQAAVKDQVMFTVEGLPKGMPIRLATMDAYDGLVWQVSAGDPTQPSLNDSGSFERVGASLSPDFAGTTAAVTVTIGKYNDVWIPDVGEVISLTFAGSAGGAERDRQLADGFRYNRATDTAASRLRLAAGDRYVMKVRLPVLKESLAGQPLVPSVSRLGQTTPVSDITQKLGPDVLTVKDSGEKLDKVKESMTKGGTYSDGDAASSQQRSRAGHSVSRLSEFVGGYPKRPLIGNAEQYAATYALLFRDLDHLPTRVVMGFVPSKDSTNGPVDVLAREVEAWVEVPVQDIGWVAIFPTPPRKQTALTASSEQQPEPDYRTQNPPPPPVLDPEFDQPATASGKAKPTKKNEDKKTSDTPTANGGGLSGPVVIGIAVGATPFVIVGSLSIAVVALKARRRRRRLGAAHARIANGWREVTDLAVDLGRPVPDTTTRLEAAAFVGSGTTVLAKRADAAVWGSGEPSDDEVDRYWGELEAALKSMRSEVGLGDRIKASVSWRSLRLARRRPHKGLDRS